MFIRRKAYNELMKQKDDFERIANKTITQNGRLLDQLRDAIEEMKSIQELNHNLQRRNEELLARIEELEAKLTFVMGQRDYYYDLLENTSEVEAKDE